MFKHLVFLATVLSLSGCYAQQMTIKDPLRLQANTPQKWALVHLQPNAKDASFLRLYRHELLQDIQTQLHLIPTEYSEITPPLKTYEGFPPRFYQTLQKEGIPLFSTGEVAFKSMIIKDTNSLTGHQMSPDRVHMDLAVTLHFWSTEEQKKLKSYRYRDAGTALVKDRALLQARLIDRVNQKVLKAFGPRYQYD